MKHPLEGLLETVPGCLAVGDVDLIAGVLTGAQTSDGPEAATLCAAAAQDLLDTAGVRVLEGLFKNRELSGVRPTDVILLSPEHLYVFVRLSSDRALVVVCRSSAELTDVITGVRAACTRA